MSINEMREELSVARAALVPALEGMRDYVRLLTDEERAARNEANNAATDFARRLDPIDAVLIGLDRLETDGYPNLEPREVPHDVYDVFTANVETVARAHAQFRVLPEAVAAVVTPGMPETK